MLLVGCRANVNVGQWGVVEQIAVVQRKEDIPEVPILISPKRHQQRTQEQIVDAFGPLLLGLWQLMRNASRSGSWIKS